MNSDESNKLKPLRHLTVKKQIKEWLTQLSLLFYDRRFIKPISNSAELF